MGSVWHEAKSGRIETSTDVLQVEGLTVSFRLDRRIVHAVDGISFNVRPGEILGVVGESGSGKTLTGLALLGLVPRPGWVSSGQARFNGRNLLRITERTFRGIRGREISMIFQDPMTSLDPVLTIGYQLRECIKVHDRRISRGGLHARSVELLRLVGIPNAERRTHQYPHEFSGGMRQRVMIAMAVANSPKLIIADEPTTALDVTIQAQVLDLIRDASSNLGASCIFITHDLGVVAELCDRIIVMYSGQIVEQATVDELFRRPRHPYTRGLLDSLPKLDDETDWLRPISGAPPTLRTRPTGCPFRVRCKLSHGRSRCSDEVPYLRQVDGSEHLTACHFAEEMTDDV